MSLETSHRRCLLSEDSLTLEPRGRTESVETCDSGQLQSCCLFTWACAYISLDLLLFAFLHVLFHISPRGLGIAKEPKAAIS